MKIGIVTDSTADLDQKILDQYEIEVVPLSVNFSNQTYTDGVDLNAEQFFDRLKEVDELPKTSQPSLQAFEDKYNKMKNKYDKILSIHVSDGLSGTYKTATKAASKITEIEIKTFDSASISLGLGFIVLLAAKLTKSLNSIDEITTKLEKAKENLLLYFTVDDMEYMEKGGRIGKAKAMLGSILNINPIISISTETGKVLPLDKTRGEKRTTTKMLELALEKLGDNNKAWLGFAHGDRIDDMEKFKEKLITKINDDLDFETFSTRISPTLGCHVGPSVYAAIILNLDFVDELI
ncbi:MAG: DegV family protein [Bacillota bacterium]